MKTHTIEIKSHQPQDQYSTSSYPGPGIYRVNDNIVLVGPASSPYFIGANIFDAAVSAAAVVPPSVAPSGVSEGTLLKAMVIASGRGEVEKFSL